MHGSYSPRLLLEIVLKMLDIALRKISSFFSFFLRQLLKLCALASSNWKQLFQAETLGRSATYGFLEGVASCDSLFFSPLPNFETCMHTDFLWRLENQ